MKIYLIRHGETVDNVAGLYAGIRNSALTNHGTEQARHLGDYFHKQGVKLTHIFSSPLSRAHNTAEAILAAQKQFLATDSDDPPHSLFPAIVVAQDLREKNFGRNEGKAFGSRARNDVQSNGKTHGQAVDPSGSHDESQDEESKVSMAQRADNFLNEHLLPLLDQKGTYDSELTIAIVSHGMLLATLWRRLLLRLARKSLSIAPEVTAARGNIILEHLGGWSNTGYLMLVMRRDQDLNDAAGNSESRQPQALVPISFSPTVPDTEVDINGIPATSSSTQTESIARMTGLVGWSCTIVAVDSRQHLIGLKRQRGGIGRLAHDPGQKKVDSFFKRQKTS